MAEPATERTVWKLARKVWGYYKVGAILFCNVLVLLVLLNVALWICFAIKDSQAAAPARPHQWCYDLYGEDVLLKAYPDLRPQELDDLLRETWTRPFAYEPYTSYKERAHQGRWVNVSAHGYRHVRNQGPWPPRRTNINLFFFGGSTAFGYGVGDDQTVASYLQEYLNTRVSPRVKVYNFGCGHWYSTQERILFEKLLVEGHVPHVALFLDGLNDTAYVKDRPMFQKSIEDAFKRWNTLHDKYEEGEVEASDWHFLASRLPMMRLARAVTGAESPRRRITEVEDEEYDPAKAIAPLLQRYPRNMALIEAAAKAHQVAPVFVWQPVPGYKYDTTYYLFNKGEPYTDQTTVIYPAMKKRIDRDPQQFQNLIWLADVQEHSEKSHYVDQLHYSADLSKVLAAEIGRQLLDRKVLP